MEAIKILIVDDHTVVRDGLSVMLGRQPDFTVVGEAGNGLIAVERARELHPDVILMDLRMPELDGVEAMRRIREEDPEARFIVLTTFDSDEYIFDAIDAGAKGYLLKDASRDELFHAVRTVHRGESLIEPGVAAKVLNRLAQLSRRGSRSDPAHILSEREVEVLQRMASGAANKDIAESLSISESTVKTHVTNIFQKLDVNHRTEAVTQALQRGIILHTGHDPKSLLPHPYGSCPTQPALPMHRDSPTPYMEPGRSPSPRTDTYVGGRPSDVVRGGPGGNNLDGVGGIRYPNGRLFKQGP